MPMKLIPPSSLPPQTLPTAIDSEAEVHDNGLQDASPSPCPNSRPANANVEPGRLLKQRFTRLLPLLPLSIDRRALNPWPTARSSIEESPPLCSKITDHIYVGSHAAAKEKAVLNAYGITHILNCVGFFCAEYYDERDLVHRTLWLRDNPSEDISSLFYDVFDYLEDVRCQGGRVLIYCRQGISRSPSFAIAYLIWRSGGHLSFNNALAQVKSGRRVANPNLGFACQLLQYQDRLQPPTTTLATHTTTNALRMYRLAPHSAYDPLHLVPIHIHNGSISALDSRGAFIIEAPDAIYVWIGQTCPPKMAETAKRSAVQISRYEKAVGQIWICRQNMEPVDFWNVFSVSKSDAGKKRVAAYNLDFELFKTASLGGILPPLLSPCTHPIRVPVRESKWSPIRPKLPSHLCKETIDANNISVCSFLSSSPTSVLSTTQYELPPAKKPKRLNGAKTIDAMEIQSDPKLLQLYSLPTLEKLDAVDGSPLRSEGAFLLIAFDSMNTDKKLKRSIYVWLGSGWMAKNREDTVKQDKDWEYTGHKIATECMPLIKECPIKVFMEGQETDGFWEHFAK